MSIDEDTKHKCVNFFCHAYGGEIPLPLGNCHCPVFFTITLPPTKQSMLHCVIIWTRSQNLTNYKKNLFVAIRLLVYIRFYPYTNQVLLEQKKTYSFYFKRLPRINLLNDKAIIINANLLGSRGFPPALHDQRRLLQRQPKFRRSHSDQGEAH